MVRTRSSDVLHLLADFFDLAFDSKRKLGDFQAFVFVAGGFRKQRVGLALHFLEQKVEFLADVGRSGEQRFELADVAGQTSQFLGDVAALRGDRSFLSQARGIDLEFAEQFLEARFEPSGERRASALGENLDAGGVCGDGRQTMGHVLT
jgi:hypothetical protein